MKRTVGIIGYPVHHSISPVFQQAAFDALRLNVVYQAWETPVEGLRERVGALRRESCLGANVTVPHKEAVLPLLDTLGASAQAVGAVNTIVNVQGRLSGYNTDVAGLRQALAREGLDLGQARTVVLGAGGSARAAVFMLIEVGNHTISVANRSLPRAETLVRDLRQRAGHSTQITALRYDDVAFAAALSTCDLLINCTSVGMSGSGTEEELPAPVELLGPAAFVYDLVYNPPETALVRAARRRGIRAASGLGMLVHQGAAAFRLWTGREAPVEVMEAAARRALGLANPA